MSLCILFIFFFSHPCSPPQPPRPCANETSTVRHMWSLFAGRGAAFGPSAGATERNKGTPRAGGTPPQPLTPRPAGAAGAWGLSPRAGRALLAASAAFSCPRQCQPRSGPPKLPEKPRETSDRDFGFPAPGEGLFSCE